MIKYLMYTEANMFFINRKEELKSFVNNYDENIENNISQVYIIEASHGIGKTEFIKEVSKYFSYIPLDIFPSDDNEELATFKRLVLELDKTSIEYGYNDFKTFYSWKTKSSKAVQLLLKITAIFGQAFAKSKEYDIEFTTLINEPIQYEKFILKAQIENLFEYAKYVFSKTNMHIVFHHTSEIDAGSIDLLCKLITSSRGSVFIFESDNEKISLRIEHCLQNNHSIYLNKYLLNKLSNKHIEIYIQQLLNDLELQADKIDSNVLKESIDKGNLAEISSILKDYNDRLRKDTSIQIRSIKDILYNLSDKQNVLLILLSYAKGKLNLDELKEITNELNNSFMTSDIDLLYQKNLIEKNNGYISVLPFVYEIVNLNDFKPALKYAVASGLIKNLNIKLNTKFNGRYLDVLVEYYLNSGHFYQLKSLRKKISQRLKSFNTQAERVDYFKKFSINRNELYQFDEEFAIIFAKVAYEANLYFEALDFINLIDNIDDEAIFLKVLILNRCEDFEKSKNYIESYLANLNNQSSVYFKLSLILIMNLIQLNQREEAFTIYKEVKAYTYEPLYPFLVRLSNVFYDDFNDRLAIVESITEDFYKSYDNEFCGLHAIYLAYLYALTQQTELAEKSLLTARNFFGNNLIYNHMILHNEATIKFYNQEIDEDIPALLNNAKITVYDEYDQFAINNNLLVYYILSDNESNLECQKIVLELEKMLERTNFKRFVDKIYYNLYYYYVKMFNFEKSEYYKSKLLLTNIKFGENYKYKLMYENSWKLPLNI